MSGQSSLQYDLVVVPDPPSQFKAERINQRQIKVTWNLPRRSAHRSGTDYHQRPIPVTGFRIYYAVDDHVIDPSSERILEVGAVTMATLDDVSPSESYIIKIRSRGTDKRFGNWSAPVTVSANRYGLNGRGGGHALSRVADLRCFGYKDGDSLNPVEASLRVTWLPPTDRRMLKEYEVRFTENLLTINLGRKKTLLWLSCVVRYEDPTAHICLSKKKPATLSGHALYRIRR